MFRAECQVIAKKLFKFATVDNISSSVMPAIYGDAKIFIKLFGKKGMI